MKCPPGTTQKTSDSFQAFRIWCVDADGYRQGPEKVWRKEKGETWLASEHNYKDGNEDGVQLAWHRNGLKQSESPMVDGRGDGITRIWHPNGRLAYQVESRNGVLVGIGRWWDENGKLRKTRDYTKHPMMDLRDEDAPSGGGK